MLIKHDRIWLTQDYFGNFNPSKVPKKQGALRLLAKIWDILRVLIFFSVLVGFAVLLAKFSEMEIAGSVRVIDGDSLTIEGREIRLFGIDAPEFQQQCGMPATSRTYPCGTQSRDYLADLVKGNPVSCVGSGVDRYERLLAICHVGNLNLNSEMVSSGWAVAYGQFHDEERSAKAEKRGIWRGSFEVPAQWRKQKIEPHKKGILSSLSWW